MAKDSKHGDEWRDQAGRGNDHYRGGVLGRARFSSAEHSGSYVERLHAAVTDAVARLKRPDHACGECSPRPRRGPGIKPGFRCVKHALLAALEEEQKP